MVQDYNCCDYDEDDRDDNDDDSANDGDDEVDVYDDIDGCQLVRWERRRPGA